MTRRFWTPITVLAILGFIAGTGHGYPYTESGKYLGPSTLVAAKDGATLYVLCIDAKQIAVVEAASGKVARSIALPSVPTGLALSPNGAHLYVTFGLPEGTVGVVEVASGLVAATIAVGHTPVAPVVSPDGKRLYVCNRFNNNVSVIDLEAKKEIARVPASREPDAAAITPDGKTLLVANLLPTDRSDSYDVAIVVTLIDTASNQTSAIRLPNGSTNSHGVCLSPDGKHAYVAHILARYQMPTTQLERGWMNTNALSILDVAAKKLVNTVLLDDVDLGAANPWGVAVTADGKHVCVTHAGTHEVSVIDMPGVMEKLSKIPVEAKPAEPGKPYDNRGSFSSATQADVPNDLAFLVDLRRRIRLQSSPLFAPQTTGPLVNGPRGLAVVGSKAYVALYFSDNLAVVDFSPKPEKQVTIVPLGPEPKLTVQRRGYMFFNDADLCFQHWQSCGSCHPDARVDSLNWDLMNDGMGNPKNNKSLFLAHKTPPAMWEGVRPNAEAGVRSGITHIQFAVRPEEDAVAIDEYLKAIEPVPSPHLVNGQLSPAAQRGKEIFFSEKIGCGVCHPEPTYTDRLMHDVESKGQYDRRADFDTPQLNECWRTAPYLHDGRYLTIKQLIKEGKHGHKQGAVTKLTEQELNDLVEFVLSL
jgi:YVTN family beta-propeller protein